MSGDATAERPSLVGRLVAEGWTHERYALLGLIALVLASFGPSFQVFLLTEVLVTALFAVGFNLLYGYTGLLSFGHAMFYAGGAYGLAIVLRDFQPVIAEAVGGGLGPLAAYFVAALVGLALVLVIAVPIGWLSVRLEEIYFALITLAFGMLIYSIIIQDPGGLTNGTDGVIVLLAATEIAGFEVSLSDRRTYYYLTLAVVALSVYAIWRIVHSPFGAVCKSIRESPDRAAALGINVTRHQWKTFIISAFFVGIAGVLNAGVANVASPNHSHWSTSATPVVATVIGGATYFSGPIVGAFVFNYVRWFISRYPVLEEYWEFFFGAMLIIVVLYFKDGAVGGLIALWSWLKEIRSIYETEGPGAAAGYVRRTVAERLGELKDGAVAKLASVGGGGGRSR